MAVPFAPSLGLTWLSEDPSLLASRNSLGIIEERLQRLSTYALDRPRLPHISSPFQGSHARGRSVLRGGPVAHTRCRSVSPASSVGSDMMSPGDVVKGQRRRRLRRANAAVLLDTSSSRESTAISAMGLAIADAPVVSQDVDQERALNGALRLAEGSSGRDVNIDELAAALEVLYNQHPAPTYPSPTYPAPTRRLPYEELLLQQVLEGKPGTWEGCASGGSSPEGALRERATAETEEGSELAASQWVDAVDLSTSAWGEEFGEAETGAAEARGRTRRGRRVGARGCEASVSASEADRDVVMADEKKKRRGRRVGASQAAVSQDMELGGGSVAKEKTAQNASGHLQTAPTNQDAKPKRGRKKKVAAPLAQEAAEVGSEQSSAESSLAQQEVSTNFEAQALESTSETMGTGGFQLGIEQEGIQEVGLSLFYSDLKPQPEPGQERPLSINPPPAQTMKSITLPTSPRKASQVVSSASADTAREHDRQELERKTSLPAVGVRVRTNQVATGGKRWQGLELLKAREASKLKQLQRQQRRLSLSSRVRLRQKKASGESCLDRSLRKWEGVELAGTAKEMAHEDLEALLRDYGDVRAATSQWMKMQSENLELEEQIRLGYLIQPATRLEKLRVQLRKDLEREPSVQEWAKAAGLPPVTLQCQVALREAARNKLLQHHIGLVLMLARHFHRRTLSFSVADLCQLGMQGLVEGTDKWDPARGIRFLAYIKYWVKNAILRSITTQGHFMRAPVHMGQDNLNIKRAQLDLEMDLGRPPTLEELARRAELKPEKCRQVLLAFQATHSLNETCPVTGVEKIESVTKSGNGIELGSDNPQIRFAIDDVLDSLKPRESLVLRQRFGLDGGGQRSFGEISKVLNCSREMVRKYELQGLAKMRVPVRMDYLRSHIME